MRTKSSAISAAIREAGLRVEDVEMRKADLEDVFLDVMSKHGDKPPPARPAEAGKGACRAARSTR